MTSPHRVLDVARVPLLVPREDEEHLEENVHGIAPFRGVPDPVVENGIAAAGVRPEHRRDQVGQIGERVVGGVVVQENLEASPAQGEALAAEVL